MFRGMRPSQEVNDDSFMLVGRKVFGAKYLTSHHDRHLCRATNVAGGA